MNIDAVLGTIVIALSLIGFVYAMVDHRRKQRARWERVKELSGLK